MRNPLVGRLVLAHVLCVLGVIASGCASNASGGDAADAVADLAAESSIDAPSDTPSDTPSPIDASDVVDASDVAADVAPDVPVDARPDGGVDVPLGDGGSTRVTVTGFSAYSNCMPIVPPDPVSASWTLNVSGSTGVTATVVSATLTVRGSSTVTQMLTVTPPSVALTGGAGSVMQRKATGTPAPTGACSALCGAGTTATIDLTVDDGTGRYTASASGSYLCAL